MIDMENLDRLSFGATDYQDVISILLVEDDPDVVTRIAEMSRKRGWRLIHRHSRDTASIEAYKRTHDIIVLDRMLGDGTGDALSLIDTLRAQAVFTPVIILSSVGSSFERTRGFHAGADLYLEKPFDPMELAAAIEAVLRRKDDAHARSANLHFGNLSLRLDNRTAIWRDEPLRLTPKSFDILETLVRSRGECVSRASLWSIAWPDYARLAPQSLVIDQAISRLRRELGWAPAPTPQIVTRRMRGYFLRVE